MKVLDIFVQILDMSVAGTFVILAVLLARGLMRRFPKKYVYALWLIVGIRLVCPVAVYSPFSLFNLNFTEDTYEVFYEAVGENETAASKQNPENQKAVSGQKNTEEDNFSKSDKQQQMSDQISENSFVLSEQSPEKTDSDAGKQKEISNTERAEGMTTDEDMAAVEQTALSVKMLHWMSIIWLAGMLLLVLWNIILTVRVRKKLGRAVRYRDNIYESDDIPSPFVLGVFSPRIYIPFRLSDREREYILRHEKYHIHRRDYLTKIIAVLITSVYWFHPLVWVSYFCMVRDMEMSCDEYVLSEMEEDVRQDYSRSLLAFAANERRFTLGTLTFGETDTRSRIKHVLKFKKKGKWMSVLAIVLFALVGTACLTNGQPSADNVSEPESVTGGAVSVSGSAVAEAADSEYDENEGMEQKLWQAIRNTMPQVVVEELEQGKCRTIQDNKEEISYLFSNKESYEGETLRLDFYYKKGALRQYVAKEYGFLTLLSSKVSELWHDPERTEEDLEDRAKQLLQQFDMEFLDRDGSSGYYRVKTPARYLSGDTPDYTYMCFKDYANGDTYLVCLRYDMVINYDAAKKKKNNTKKDTEIKIAYKNPDTPNGQWEYYIPRSWDQKMLQEYVRHLGAYESDWEQERLHKSLKKEKETGLALYYKGDYWVGYTGGLFSRDYGDGKVIYSAKLYYLPRSYLANVLDYALIADIKDIKNVTSAELVYCPSKDSEGDSGKLTITDPSQLEMLQQAFSEAEYIRGGSDCPFGKVTLCLKRNSEKDVLHPDMILTLAEDDCPIFRLNGVCYKYDDSKFSSSLKDILRDYKEAMQ